MQKLVGIVVAFFVLAAVFSVLERFWPAIPGQRWWRAGTWLDIYYWFFTPLVSKPLATGATILAVLPPMIVVAVALHMPVRTLFTHTWLFGRHPPLLQAIEALLIGDLIGYWAHRLFHGRALWRFHAIHHAPRELDWLSATRLHPVNEVVDRVLQAVPLFLLGFRPGVLGVAVPFFTFYAVMVHANLPWTLGKLRYIFASPCFHRWHHTSESEGLDKNFAGLFSFYDLIFGTFYMPEGRQPQRFGVVGTDMPEGFWAQLVYPFRAGSGRR